MKQVSDLEVDIEAMVFRLESMPNDKTEIARLLPVTKDKIEEVLEESGIFLNKRDRYVRKKRYEDELGTFQIVFPVKIQCERCEEFIQPFDKIYRSGYGNSVETCQSCQKKEALMDGLKDASEKKHEYSTIAQPRSGKQTTQGG